jgi:hypothetical protein
MNIRYFALIFGIIYLLVGIAGFIPGLTQPPPANAPAISLNSAYGYELGLFPVNVLHSIVHILIGIWGIFAFASYGAARTYARAAAIIFAVLFIMGLIPGLNTVFGLIPLHGNDVWLHAITALVAGYFGYVAASRPAATTPPASL